LAFIYCKSSSIPFVLFSESTASEPSWQRTVTKPLVKLMVKASDGVVGISSRAVNYFLELGTKKEKTHLMLSTSFSPVKKPNPAQLAKVRQGLSIPDDSVVVLFVGQFIPRKGIQTILDAALHLKNSSEVFFVLVGYGDLQDDIDQFSKKNNLDSIKSVSYTTADEIWNYYFSSDIFILPSLEETWGLVVNEAMEASLPILLSKNVGCSDDLLIEGENGFSFAARDSKTVAKHIQHLSRNSSLKKEMGKKSKSIISKISVSSQSQVIIDLINTLTTK
jgi:glycosyltransferase involved in cell wall biosynthesis